ncbi:MAG: response regulator [Chloroflexota bacterium]
MAHVLLSVAAIAAVALGGGLLAGGTRRHAPKPYQHSPTFRTLAEAPDGASAVDAARLSQPDVIVVMDIQMPRVSGIDATRAISQWSQVQSPHPDQAASEYLLHSSKQAVQAICWGQTPTRS